MNPVFPLISRRGAVFASLALTLVSGSVWGAGPEVAVVSVQPQAVPTGMEFDGVIQPVRQSTVAAQAAGDRKSVV